MSPHPSQLWKHVEERRLADLVSRGFKNKEIAGRLRRSARAVEKRCQKLRLVRRNTVKVRPASEPFVAPALTIQKSELSEYYALGWRVSWFEGNQVGLEWPYGNCCPSIAPITQHETAA